MRFAILPILALLTLGAYQSCQSVEDAQIQAAASARESVCNCFARRGLNATCSKLDTMPVLFSGFVVDNGVTRELGHYNHVTGIWVALYDGVVGRAIWRQRDELERTLRHEYVHALLDLSGLPYSDENSPEMKDCEK